jgi:hypothetical protein
MILKWILREQDGGALTGLIWLQIGADDGDFMNMVMNIQFCK